MKLYIALPNTYFDVGTEAELLDKIDGQSALFFGLKNGKFDEAVCRYKEFKVRYVPEQGARSAGGDTYAEQKYD
jgi:hypothetical protein